MFSNKNFREKLLSSKSAKKFTNCPYLGAGKQNDLLRRFVESNYPDSKVDLANVFLERCLELSLEESGVVQVVMPESWLLQSRSQNQRKKTLQESQWLFLGLLGGGGDAFERGPGNIISIICLSILNRRFFQAYSDADLVLHGIDASKSPNPSEKAEALRS